MPQPQGKAELSDLEKADCKTGKILGGIALKPERDWPHRRHPVHRLLRGQPLAPKTDASFPHSHSEAYRPAPPSPALKTPAHRLGIADRRPLCQPVTAGKSAVFEKILSRLAQIDPRKVQSLLSHLVREKGFLQKVFEALQGGACCSTARAASASSTMPVVAFSGPPPRRPRGARSTKWSAVSTGDHSWKASDALSLCQKETKGPEIPPIR